MVNIDIVRKKLTDYLKTAGDGGLEDAARGTGVNRNTLAKIRDGTVDARPETLRKVNSWLNKMTQQGNSEADDTFELIGDEIESGLRVFRSAAHESIKTKKFSSMLTVLEAIAKTRNIPT